jgi:quercetin dioxygenase-like cupin family protein
VSHVPQPAMQLLHLYADEHGETQLGTTEIALPLRDFAPPATPLHASEGQPATQYVLIRLPVGWVGEQHTSPKPQVLFCLTGSIKITCSTGEAVAIDAGMGVVMTDVGGKGHKSEVMSAEPVSAVIIQ